MHVLKIHFLEDSHAWADISTCPSFEANQFFFNFLSFQAASFEFHQYRYTWVALWVGFYFFWGAVCAFVWVFCLSLLVFGGIFFSSCCLEWCLFLLQVCIGLFWGFFFFLGCVLFLRVVLQQNWGRFTWKLLGPCTACLVRNCNFSCKAVNPCWFYLQSPYHWGYFQHPHHLALLKCLISFPIPPFCYVNPFRFLPFSQN